MTFIRIEENLWGAKIYRLFGVKLFIRGRTRKYLEAIRHAIADPNGIGMLNLLMNNLGVPKKYRHLFYEMGEGDVCIDCGANVGKFTDLVLHTGASVHLFEPNRMLVRSLRHKYGAMAKRVVISEAAVAANAGEMTLYNSEDSKNDITATAAGSIISDYLARKETEAKTVVGEKVRVVDLVAYIEGNFPSAAASPEAPPIYLLKIDIEGAEFGLLEKIIKERVFNLCKHIVVETHQRMFPDGREKLARLRKLIAENNITNISLDWL